MNFTFTYTTNPSQCEAFAVSWQGMTSTQSSCQRPNCAHRPQGGMRLYSHIHRGKCTWVNTFHRKLLTQLHIYAQSLPVSIPSSSVSNGRGFYQLPLPVKANQQLVVVMSDSSGFASGGISDVVTVDQPQDNAACEISSLAESSVFVQIQYRAVWFPD